MPVAEKILETRPATPDLPVLKKREDKEKRGAGFLWPGSAASPVGSGFFGASTGQGGLLGLGRIAAVIARVFGGSATTIGRLLLSKAGSWLVLGGLTAGGAAVLGVASWVTSRFAPAPQVAASRFAAPLLDGVQENIHIRRPQDTSLNNLKSTPGAEPDYGQLHKEARAPEPTPAVKAEEPAPVPPIKEAKDAMAAEAKKQGLDLSKLSGLAGLVGGSGGAGPQGMPDLSRTTLAGPGNEFKLRNNIIPASNFVKLKALTPFENKAPLTTTREGHQKATSQRAMGQLKFASDMSNAGKTAGVNEVGKTFSTDAFEQGRTTGGVMQGVGDGIVPPNPNPAPNFTTNPGANVTPWQNQITSAQQNTGVSAALKVAGMAAIAAGIALIIAGIALLPWPTTPIGIALIMAGIALVMAGLAMLAQSANMANKANNQGQNINNQYGQQDQANIVNSCSQQANQQGIQPQNCNNGNFQMPGNSVHQSVMDESLSTYNLDGGTPAH